MLDSVTKGQSGEDFVNHIAFRSFVKYWCFPGPTDLTKDNKEICDLLVLFDDICIIISVKNYDFKGNYERYFRNTVDKAIRQIEGAERKLFRDDLLLIKHPDRDEEIFKKENYKRIYRVIVNLNEDVKYYQTSYFKDGKSYSVMDAAAWYTSMEEMNTIPDITAYLSSRCALFSEHPAFIFPRSEYDIATNDKISARAQMEEIARSGQKLTIVNGSELDLIAEYIGHEFKFPKELNHNHKEGNNLLLNIDGRWNKFASSKAATTKAHYEKESYFIDRLVKEFLINTGDGNHLATIFFRLDRFQRSELADAFLKYHEGHAMGDVNVKLNRSHVVLPFINMVFVCYDNEYPIEELDKIITLSLAHHHYLRRFECKEVGALGMSKTSMKFTFGYSKIIEDYTQEEIDEMKKDFALIGWQTEQLSP